MTEDQPVSFNRGDVYRFVRHGKDGEQLCGRYSVVGVATHTHSRQDVVVYRGIDGDDRGKLFCCTLFDWDLKFRPVEQPAEAPEVVPSVRDVPAAAEGKTVGFIQKGNPW